MKLIKYLHLVSFILLIRTQLNIAYSHYRQLSVSFHWQSNRKETKK